MDNFFLKHIMVILHLIQNVLIVKISDIDISKRNDSEEHFVGLDNHFQNFSFDNPKPIVVVSYIRHNDGEHENILEYFIIHIIIVRPSYVKHSIVNEDGICQKRR
jgi:hypothetical protein